MKKELYILLRSTWSHLDSESCFIDCTSSNINLSICRSFDDHKPLASEITDVFTPNELLLDWNMLRGVCDMGLLGGVAKSHMEPCDKAGVIIVQ